MNKYSLGIDTSNYKTSVAITDERGAAVWSRSELLDVKRGELGLRQSDAFFKHSNRLPDFIREAFAAVSPEKIACIAVSNAPRRVERSYMPVFLAGVNSAQIAANSLRVPLYTFSHQEGHIVAILGDIERDLERDICVFHLSGGTTEVLLCRKQGAHIECDIVGGTLDISFGQLLDRIGVLLGYEFPAGKYLDETALASSKDDDSINLGRVKISDSGMFNLSGIETKLKNSEISDAHVKALFNLIIDTLKNEISYVKSKYGTADFYFAGGVSSSRYIQSAMPEYRWSTPELSGDNAVGISRLGGLAYRWNL